MRGFYSIRCDLGAQLRIVETENNLARIRPPYGWGESLFIIVTTSVAVSSERQILGAWGTVDAVAGRSCTPCAGDAALLRPVQDANDVHPCRFTCAVVGRRRRTEPHDQVQR